MRTLRALPLAAVAVTIVLLLAGCHSNPGNPVGSTAASASPSASASTAGPTPTSSVPASAACTRDGLKITYQGTDNTAGHFHGVLTFTNTGAACSMNGYPIVYVGQPEAEEPMGAASTNDTTSAPALVNLAAGASAHAAVTITDAGVVCDPVDTTYLLASPPLSHPFEWTSDAEHVYNVNIGGCNDSSVSLIQVGAVTG
ncbi:MAG: DUF4232 domain-containing protein [Pseudolysinimonas sp.]